MKVLSHHIYEYKKGLRNLVLHTMHRSELAFAEEKLQRHQISYFVQSISPSKVNIFFGQQQCVQIVQSFGRDSLRDFDHQQDFMLGIMLGYDRMQQCARYLQRTAPACSTEHTATAATAQSATLLSGAPRPIAALHQAAASGAPKRLLCQKQV